MHSFKSYVCGRAFAQVNFQPSADHTLISGGERNDRPLAPENFFCPITQDMMRDPVMLGDGHTCECWLPNLCGATCAMVLSVATDERKAITEWLRAHTTSPMTNARLTLSERSEF